MNRLVRVGIIGLGFGARVHLPAFQSLPNVRVIAVADAGSGKADRVEVEHKGIRAFHDWRHMIANVESDAVSVATPPDVQQGIVCAALAAGKHVLSEKPFGTDVSAARAMLRAAQMSGRIHAIDFQFRMEPGIRGLKRQISLGKIGRVIRIDVTWLTAGRSDPALPFSWQNDAARGGGVLNNFGSHVIDYVEWISASRITTVNASARIIHAQRFDADGCEHTVTAEDSCDMTCALANGAIARVHFSNCYPIALGHRIEIYGEQGRLVFIHEPPFTSEQTRLSIETRMRRMAPIPLKRLLMTNDADSRVPAFRELARRFVDAIRGRPAADLPDFARGLEVHQALQAARDSIAQRREIRVEG